MVGTGEQFHPFLLGTGVPGLGVDRHHSVPEPAEGAEGVGSRQRRILQWSGWGNPKPGTRGGFRDLVPHATKKDGSFMKRHPQQRWCFGDQVTFGPRTGESPKVPNVTGESNGLGFAPPQLTEDGRAMSSRTGSGTHTVVDEWCQQKVVGPWVI